MEKSIAQERPIHDSLVRQAAAGVASIYNNWKKNGRIDPFFMAWPTGTLIGSDGAEISDICMLDLREQHKAEWPRLMREAIQLTNAYALLLCEQRANDISVILESTQGTRAWTVPIIRSGDVRILGKTSYRDNVESVGLLWTPTRASA
jgi:hypothetical protein